MNVPALSERIHCHTCTCPSCISEQALVNVPALSERTLRRDIAKAEVSTGPEIQVLYITHIHVHKCMYTSTLVYMYMSHFT